MLRSKIGGIGYYVPEKIVTNHDLTKLMDTSDKWIQERTGIKERRFAEKHKETSATMGTAAARIAIERAGITVEDVDFIVFATLSPDYYFPGCAVLLQRQMGMQGIGALDIRNQCSGFVYGMSIADQFVKTGMYKNVLLVGSEVHSFGLDYSTKGRNVTVIFGDGAGAVVLQPTDDQKSGILSTHLHADGDYAEKLAYLNPGCHGGVHLGPEHFGYPEQEFGGAYLTEKMWQEEQYYPNMEGQAVFKMAVQKFPEVIMEALQTNGLQPTDINMLIPHQANLRISQFVQKRLGLRDDQVLSLIHI